jgi:hypothetical protein
MISKKFMDDKIKEQYEKELQVAKDVITAKILDMAKQLVVNILDQ